MLGPLHCDQLALAPLLPKLRGHFAEFLNNSSPVGLRVLLLPTCVGLRYGCLRPYLATFLASVDSSTYLLFFTSPSALSFLHRYFTLCPLLALAALFHPHGLTILLRHCFIYSNFGSTGISTGCPSSTPFDLDLGPDLPRAAEPSPGNLRLSTERFLASLSLLMPAFSLLYSPRLLSVSLLPV